MPTQGYNGWTNYATWNVNLWIDNEYPLYQAKVELLRNRTIPVTGQTVRNFCQIKMGGTTPDLQEMKRTREPHGRINYREIADHWEDERKELHSEPSS